MADDLEHSPEMITARLLRTLGVANRPNSGLPWPVYVSREPSSPDNIVTVLSAADSDKGRVHTSGERQVFYGTIIRVRSVNYADGYARANTIAQYLDLVVYNTPVQIDDHVYTVHAYTRPSDIRALGTETPSSKRHGFEFMATFTLDVHVLDDVGNETDGEGEVEVPPVIPPDPEPEPPDPPDPPPDDLTPPSAVINIDNAWLAGKTPPYALNQANTLYLLQVDVTVPHQAFTLTGRNSWLDLNGHTVTYNNFASGVPNDNFEDGTGAVPALWDLTNAPGAARTSTFSKPMDRRWYLNVTDNGADQSIVSDWFDLLTPNIYHWMYYLRGNIASQCRELIRTEIFHETLGLIGGTDSWIQWLFEFRTPAPAGRYRVKMTFLHETRPDWTPLTAFKIGDAIDIGHPTVFWVLKSIGGATGGTSGTTEPNWNKTLGALTTDGNLTWRTLTAGGLVFGTAWAPNKNYTIGTVVRAVVGTGHFYQLFKVAVPGVTSGSTEPVWKVPPANIDTTETAPTGQVLSWDQLQKSNPAIDSFDVRPFNAAGIVSTYANNQTPSNNVIRNGLIRQGPGKGYACHAIRAGGWRGGYLEALDIITTGIESQALSVSGHDVVTRNNLIQTQATNKFNRTQLSAAVYYSSANNAIIINNTIYSGEAWGGIYLDANCSDGFVDTNEVFSTATTTNHFAIMAYGHRHIVSNNYVEGDPGQGIRVQMDNHLVEGNTITLRSVGPNWDDGRISLDGMRLNDYEAGTIVNCTVRNNTIILWGNNSPYYEVAEQYLNGITNNTNGLGNVYENNVITCHKMTPEVIVSGLMPGSTTGFTVTWRGNTIISDEFCIIFGSYPNGCYNARFENNTFQQGDNPAGNYSILSAIPRSATKLVANTIFHNSTIVGPGTLKTIHTPNNFVPPSNWKTHINVDATAHPNVIVRDVFNVIQYQGVGAIVEVPQTDVVVASNSYSYTEHEPYTVSPA